MNAVWVEITATRGSAPRDAGTVMKVTADATQGTIGGGALEFAAIARARRMLASGERAFAETLPLGPTLGQCCGGAVRLCYGTTPKATDKPQTKPLFTPHRGGQRLPLWLWGAGHVGRAVVATCPADAFDITWVDSGADRFPPSVAPHVTPIPTVDMPRLAARAPMAAHHLIFTYSHDIDLALCAALLKRGFGSCGLIGSDTKWTRFGRRLRAMGLDPAPITCPIGDKSLGKMPVQIAQGTVTALLSQAERKAPA